MLRKKNIITIIVVFAVVAFGSWQILFTLYVSKYCPTTPLNSAFAYALRKGMYKISTESVGSVNNKCNDACFLIYGSTEYNRCDYWWIFRHCVVVVMRDPGLASRQWENDIRFISMNPCGFIIDTSRIQDVEDGARGIFWDILGCGNYSPIEAKLLIIDDDGKVATTMMLGGKYGENQD